MQLVLKFFRGSDDFKMQKVYLLQLKVLTNEKKGGLKVVSFNRSRFKLFTLRFSNKSVQAPSCEGPKTAQRSLILSFEITYCTV
jgi:hypothetical protein